MARRQFFIPSSVMPMAAVMVEDFGVREYFIPALGMFNEEVLPLFRYRPPTRLGLGI